MELTNSNDENSFDPTPKLKSSRTCRSSSFKDERICSYCENEYSETLLFEKKYCKICLSGYIKDNDDNVYLDVHISTSNTPCGKHETSRSSDFYTQNIREWSENYGRNKVIEGKNTVIYVEN